MTAWVEEDGGWAEGHSRRQVQRLEPGQSILTDLSDVLMERTDELVEALDAETDARVEYDDAFGAALVQHHRDKVQMAIITKITDHTVRHELAALTRAEGKVKRCRAKVLDVSARLTAAQSQAKYSGLADGGQR